MASGRHDSDGSLFHGVVAGAPHPASINPRAAGSLAFQVGQPHEENGHEPAGSVTAIGLGRGARRYRVLKTGYPGARQRFHWVVAGPGGAAVGS